MKYFSVPADFKKETIDKYKKLNDSYEGSSIFETFGNIKFENPFGSGRLKDTLPDVNMDRLKEYIEYSKDNGIGFNYTMNASTLKNKELTKDGIVEIKEFLKKLYGIGVRDITASLPSLIEIIKSTNDNFKIKTSTISGVNTPNKAVAYKNMGVDRIVTDEGINRNFRTLKDIVNAFGENVELLVNVVCYNNCIYRQFHYNYYCFESVENSSYFDYFINRCCQRMLNDPSIFIKNSWIRPEDIKHYYNIGIKYFKIQGRDLILRADPYKTLEYYFKESYNGDLWELIMMFDKKYIPTVRIDNKKLDGFIDPFVKIENFCKNSCANCQYCNKYIEKAIDTKDLAVYKDYINSEKYDKFSKEIKE
jgi:hypothetical protein